MHENQFIHFIDFNAGIRACDCSPSFPVSTVIIFCRNCRTMDRNILFYFAVVWVLRFVLGAPIWLNTIILPILHLLGGYDHISVIVRTSKRDFV